MREGPTRLIRMASAEPIDVIPLGGGANCEVLVVGGGIAGLSSAYEAARCGRSVMLIDRGEIARGTEVKRA